MCKDPSYPTNYFRSGVRHLQIFSSAIVLEPTTLLVVPRTTVGHWFRSDSHCRRLITRRPSVVLIDPKRDVQYLLLHTNSEKSIASGLEAKAHPQIHIYTLLHNFLIQQCLTVCAYPSVLLIKEYICFLAASQFVLVEITQGSVVDGNSLNPDVGMTSVVLGSFPSLLQGV
jgi:hypothetical protein